MLERGFPKKTTFMFEWPSASAISVLCRLMILAILVLGVVSHRVVLS